MTGKYIKRKIRNAKKWISERPYYIRRTWNRLLIGKRNFTIISNNCWAGRVYQYLGIPYLTPTVGLYFFAEDYIKFVSNLRYYFSLDLEFILLEQSRYSSILKNKNQTSVPIGKLDDIEIIFLHYQSEQEAKEKWERRKKRVNYEDIFLKFSRMNLCSEKEIQMFVELPHSNKILLNNCKLKNYPCEVYWKGPSNQIEITSDTRPFPGNVRLTNFLNRKPESYQ